MTKVVAYTRGQAGSIGSRESLSFSRRVGVPLSSLRASSLFSAFELHDLEEEEILSEGMLLGPDVVVFQNFLPRTEEIDAFRSASGKLRAGGNLPLWVYDLDEHLLLQESGVLAILPLMRLITVPNEYLAHEVETLSHSVQLVEQTSSTFDLAAFQQYLLRQSPQERKQNEEYFTLGCLGRNDWERLLPGLFVALHEQVPNDQLARIHLLTDTPSVAELAVDHGIESAIIGIPHGIRSTYYPQYLAQITIGLLPREGQTSDDTAWLWEYGAMGIPCLAAIGSSYENRKLLASGATFLPLDQPKEWAEVLIHWMDQEAERKVFGRQAATFSLEHRVALQVAAYTRVYRQILPLSARAH